MVDGVRPPNPIPKFTLPLRAGDDEPEIDLGALLGRLYDTAAYDLRAEYRRDAMTPLARDADWAASLAGRRTGSQPSRDARRSAPRRSREESPRTGEL